MTFLLGTGVPKSAVVLMKNSACLFQECISAEKADLSLPYLIEKALTIERPTQALILFEETLITNARISQALSDGLSLGGIPCKPRSWSQAILSIKEKQSVPLETTTNILKELSDTQLLFLMQQLYFQNATVF